MVADLSADAQWSDLVWVLRDTRAALSRSGNDFSWSSWKDHTAAIAEMDSIIGLAQDQRLDVAAMAYFYAPTGPIQEVSLSSGWGDEFLALADRFDIASTGL